MDAAEIEVFLLRAWPALEERDLDGWRLRFAGGYTKRANSVAVLGTSCRRLEEKVRECEAAYAERGLPAIFKINEFSPDAGQLDTILAERGYALVDACLVLGLNVPDCAADRDGLPERTTEVETLGQEEWLAAHAHLAGLADSEPHRRILSRIDMPCLHAALAHDGRLAACGLAVLESPLCAVFDLLVRKDLRRQGLGLRLSRAMLAWAAQGGARRIVLQALVSNEPALTLYRSLGFAPLYRYWYRRQA
ncbi:GNAT family N-acetyltransferase [Desulfocurvibacter africanus]|uniref:GNAT family N-acetyltransferase n=1 Tax=Desulfocurvibacter africanus TaxID=873 RepID=UPI002FDB5ADE